MNQNSFQENPNQSPMNQGYGMPIEQPMVNTLTKSPKNIKNILMISIAVLIGIILILITLLLVPLQEQKEFTRTVMIYMVGADLESGKGLATADLESVQYQKIDNENVNVVLIAGGANTWDNDYIDEEETSIYELTNNGYEKVKTQSIQNMGDDEVFTNFLDYVYENYHTDKYDLIFWDHGGAIIGSEFDEISNDNLSLTEMQEGISNSKFKNKKLELVMFRTCLNGSIEVADAFKNYAEYLVASEEITIGTTMTSVLNFINEIETTDSAYDVGLKFVQAYQQNVQGYKEYCKLVGADNSIYSTYSIMDLSKVSNVIAALNDFIEDINITSDYNTISKVRSNLYQYAGTDSPGYDMVDLYNLVDGLKELSYQKAEKVLNALEDCILYNWATNDSSRGMSIYFPYNGSTSEKSILLNLYSNFYNLSTYKTFITNFNKIQSNESKSYSFSNNNSTVSDMKDGEADFTLELTDEQLEGFAKAEYLVFMDKGDGYYWPVYKGLKVTLDGNQLKANISGTSLKIDDYVVPLYETYHDDETIKYTTTVVLEDFSGSSSSDWKMDTAKLTLVLDSKTGDVQVGSVLLSNSNDDLPNMVGVSLLDYQYITFGSMSHKLVDEDGNVSMELFTSENNGIYEGVEITPEEIYNFKLSDFNDDNNYYCVFRIYDVNNNVYYSKLIKMN